MTTVTKYGEERWKIDQLKHSFQLTHDQIK